MRQFAKFYPIKVVINLHKVGSCVDWFYLLLVSSERCLTSLCHSLNGKTNSLKKKRQFIYKLNISIYRSPLNKMLERRWMNVDTTVDTSDTLFIRRTFKFRWRLCMCSCFCLLSALNVLINLGSHKLYDNCTTIVSRTFWSWDLEIMLYLGNIIGSYYYCTENRKKTKKSQLG